MMVFDFTEEEKDFQKEVEDFVKNELPPDWDDKAIFWPGGYGTFPDMETEFIDFSRQFFRKLGAKGWLSLGWPEEYGGRNSMMKQAIVNDVLTYYRAPFGILTYSIVGPAVCHVGDEKTKREWLPRIGNGEILFWIGYSEPNSGSDLSSIKTTAVLDGDDYVINGQKIWSSQAHVADYCWLLARTDLEAPKHRSASVFIVDNTTPGIDIRPLENICGIHCFNEVFFDDVRVPRENMVGEINQGFYHIMQALQYERMAIGPGGYRRVIEELIDYAKKTESNGEMLSKNPHIRYRLASMFIEMEVLSGFYWRSISMLDKGVVPELEASALKLFGSELGQRLAAAAMDVLGPYSQLSKGSKWAPLAGKIPAGYLDSVSGPIGAGTSEVQRSIIATRGLGLPRY